jgi:thiamine biosynthesis lipoprotein
VIPVLSIELLTMGCHARVVLDAEGAAAQAALDRMPAWFAERERVLSRFAPESALARLNARGGADGVDDVLWGALDVALTAAAESNGLVTPTILGALEAAGYDRDFRDVPRAAGAAREPDTTGEPGAFPESPEDHAALRPSLATPPAPDWRAIERDPITRSIRLPAGLRLDLGGTAKGWCADAAALSLAHLGPALVDLGGDIALTRAHRAPWPIAIADPRGGADALELVVLREGGIATSGRDYRRWRREGREQHHLIDPRTGAPSRTDVLTATVIAPRAITAEIAAKRVLLEGSVAGMAWLERRPELAALIVREDGEVRRSARFETHAWKDVA